MPSHPQEWGKDAKRVIMKSNKVNTIAMYEEKEIGKDRRSNLK
jgi:hypothetical protein